MSPDRDRISAGRPEGPVHGDGSGQVLGADHVEVRHEVRQELTLLPELVTQRPAGRQVVDSSGGDVDPAGRIDLAGHGVTAGLGWTRADSCAWSILA